MSQATQPEGVIAPEDRLFGWIDFYGFNRQASGFIFIGWVSHSLAKELGGGDFIIRCSSGDVRGPAQVAFYPRQQVQELGIGYIIFVSSQEALPGSVLFLTTVDNSDRFAIRPGEKMQDFTEIGPPSWFEAVLLEAKPALDKAVIEALRPTAHRGHIELYGYDPALRGWLAMGWVATPQLQQPWDTAKFRTDGTEGEADGQCVAYDRPDLGGRGVGIVLFARPPRGTTTILTGIEIALGTTLLRLTPVENAPPIDMPSLRDEIKGRLLGAPDGAARNRMLQLVSKPRYTGEDTLASLVEPALANVDMAIFVPPDGVVLKGWLLAAPGAVKQITLCSGNDETGLDIASFVRVARPDVVNSIGQEYGIDNPMVGFIAFAPQGYSPHRTTYLEIEMSRGETAYKNLPRPKLQGLAAIRRILGDCDLQYGAVRPAFDRVLGPSISRLNAQRLSVRPTVATLHFGTRPENPVFSIVVPLYRQLEYIELQFALFQSDPAMAQCELIYVLDDPEKQRELENLAAAVYARSRIAFTLALLSHNVGFAPACNVGLELARGRYVCFLNSDVFPQTAGWLPKLADALDRRPDLGIVGPLLLFEDGSVQHQGMTWERLPQFGDWYYNVHYGMHRRPSPKGGLREFQAITAASVLLRYDDAAVLGGFDEAFIVGDFEDSDLCLRLRERGLGAAVDRDVRQVHLVRQSQAASRERWRLNLTLYNAWLHDTRWGATIQQLMRAGADPGDELPPPDPATQPRLGEYA